MILHRPAWMCFENIDAHQKVVKSFLSIPEQGGPSVWCMSEQKHHWSISECHNSV